MFVIEDELDHFEEKLTKNLQIFLFKWDPVHFFGIRI
jgi:hypothetical protein